MEKFAKPVLVVSKCLGFAACRYNGLTIASDVVDNLNPHVDFQPVCPEVELGLGVPRHPIRVTASGETLRLVQPATEKNVTQPMRAFAREFLSALPVVDGFILKNRSPSCGIKDVKIYSEKGHALRKEAGFFGGQVLAMFPHLPVEDEGRLTNFRIREHFLTRLFTLAAFRQIRSSRAMKDLVRFHTRNKFLLMSYHQQELQALGRIVANLDKKPVPDVMAEYERHLQKALARPSRLTSNINVLMHALGYFSKGLAHEEKAFFLDSLAQYRAGKIPLSVPASLIRAWAVRFRQTYLMDQTFFKPYPQELMEITDSGKGRDW